MVRRREAPSRTMRPQPGLHPSRRGYAAPQDEGGEASRAISSSLRANGSRERAPDDRLREAIQSSTGKLDCFVAAPLAMTEGLHLLLRLALPLARPAGLIDLDRDIERFRAAAIAGAAHGGRAEIIQPDRDA